MNQEAPQDRTISGKVIVLSMFTLAIVATGTLWAYWSLHMLPFMPLQEALAEQFENSSPRVDGGRRKMQNSTPMILRAVMRVPFDPNDSSAETQDLIEDRITATMELAVRYTPVNEYEILEIHLYMEKKEDAISQKTFSKTFEYPRSPT